MANHVLSLVEASRIYNGLDASAREALHAHVQENSAWHIDGEDLRLESIAVIRWEDWEAVIEKSSKK